jgi:hypothetical protein
LWYREKGFLFDKRFGKDRPGDNQGGNNNDKNDFCLENIQELLFFYALFFVQTGRFPFLVPYPDRMGN